MAVRKATGFLTTDGRFFGPHEEAEAQKHELLVKLQEFCEDLDILIGQEGRDTIAQGLYNRRDELNRILNGLDETIAISSLHETGSGK